MKKAPAERKDRGTAVFWLTLARQKVTRDKTYRKTDGRLKTLNLAVINENFSKIISTFFV